MLKDMLLSNNAVKYGDFVLPYGRRTDFFVSIKEVSTDPRLLDLLAEELSKNVRSDMIAGVELGAVPLLVAVSLKRNLPYAIVRKKYEHGTKDLIVGRIEKGRQIDMIEDVVSSGNSILNAAKLLTERGARISRAVCVVDREEGGAGLLGDNGIELISLVRRGEIIEEGIK
ncbi:MAG: orotate phosphoribosyltransferase [Candidatus Marsarchaeota archaeon]|nr:orotate phosphoribosyltransferase [Candidatus Marsarchaeota archaeon]MCL5413360.1 orotate phosphoribosyltransferase [Candidatus Marsarchaeota archaeon]